MYKNTDIYKNIYIEYWAHKQQVNHRLVTIV